MAVVMDADRMGRTLTRIAHEIVERNRGVEELALVGIRTAGVPLARRIARILAEITRRDPSTLRVDPSTPLRVDPSTLRVDPSTKLGADPSNRDEGSKVDVPTGALDITLYRDDLMRHTVGTQPVVRSTEISFSIDDKRILLVDDVLFTGRTIRAALDALIEFGRPRSIQLVVMVDRGHRELPIKADYVGKNLPTSLSQSVKVHLMEIDGRDAVEIEG
jgi:pyrimidine operon attenuation protein / uracil phosphoribosyltransferase